MLIVNFLIQSDSKSDILQIVYVEMILVIGLVLVALCGMMLLIKNQRPILSGKEFPCLLEKEALIFLRISASLITVSGM